MRNTWFPTWTLVEECWQHEFRLGNECFTVAHLSDRYQCWRWDRWPTAHAEASVQVANHSNPHSQVCIGSEKCRTGLLLVQMSTAPRKLMYWCWCCHNGAVEQFGSPYPHIEMPADSAVQKVMWTRHKGQIEQVLQWSSVMMRCSSIGREWMAQQSRGYSGTAFSQVVWSELDKASPEPEKVR